MHTTHTSLFALVLACGLTISITASRSQAQETASASTAAPSSAQSAASDHAESLPARQSSSPVQTTPETAQGIRERLEAHGIVLGFRYQAEVFGNLRRGRSADRGATLLGSGQSSLEVDLSKARMGRGQVFISGQTLHGKGINESRVGAVQLPSNLDAERFTRVIDAWYGDSYFQDRLKFKLGRQYADADFGVIENGGDFLNASYGVLPTSPMPTYPLPAFGITAWVSATEWLALGAGAFRGDKLEPVEEDGPSLRKGVFTLAEAKIEPHSKTSSRYGVYRFGIWQQADGAWLADVTDSATVVRNYGVYAGADYWFRRKSDEDRGPGVFLRLGWAPSDRNEVSGYWSGGLTYPGLNPLRRQDTIGLGITQVQLQGRRRETVLELFYKLQVSKVITLQPDLQWIHKASGEGPNGAVAGLRLGLNF